MEITIDVLRSLMPTLKEARATLLLPFLLEAMDEAVINGEWRTSAFLAQVGHESCDLLYFEELASGAAYEGRADLGNTHPGDGIKYKGRGPIQLTGLGNYIRAGHDLNLDIVNHPELVSAPEIGFRTTAWFWCHGTRFNLNDLADQKKFDDITRAINGGLNGKPDRDLRYARALKILGA